MSACKTQADSEILINQANLSIVRNALEHLMRQNARLTFQYTYLLVKSRIYV